MSTARAKRVSPRKSLHFTILTCHARQVGLTLAHRLYLVLSLLGFNLGIEGMQLGVVIAFLPWLVMLSRTDLHRRFRVGIASLAGVAAIGWAAERVMSRPNAVTRTTAAVASHP